jgi:hypothetical protein
VQSVRATGKPKAPRWIMKERGLRDYFIHALGGSGGFDLEKYDRDEDAADHLPNTDFGNWHAREEFLDDVLFSCGWGGQRTEEDYEAFMRSTTYLNWWASNPSEIVKRVKAKLQRTLLEAGVKFKSISMAERQTIIAKRLAAGVGLYMGWDPPNPDEPRLGSLTSEERSWLTNAFGHLYRIYENREASRPGKNAFCIFKVGNVYVQFYAPSDAEELVCEAVSAKFVPEVAGILGADGEMALRRLGFMPPEISANYSQKIKIGGVDDLASAARLAFRVLKQVYKVAEFSLATFKENIPSPNT